MLRPSLAAGCFFALTQWFPGWRPALWRRWYDALAHRDLSGHLRFMNYGYDDGSRTPLDAEDEPFRYGIQLYRRAVQGLDLSGKDLLEVGCGRGGGGSFLLRYYKPRSYMGVDLSPGAIAWCQRHHAFPNAEWRVGLADDIPAASSSIDVVVNVESSHSYPSFPAFLSEVHRVLRPGGHLALADLRKDGQLPSRGVQRLRRRAAFRSLQHARGWAVEVLRAPAAEGVKFCRANFSALYRSISPQRWLPTS